MNKSWDTSGVALDIRTWTEILRVLKPGGHLLVFGLPRTYHRVACAIEDAGFEIRDSIHWVFGSGFPKSHDVSKAIDKQVGAERVVVGIRTHPTLADTSKIEEQANASHGDNVRRREWEITAPSTEPAKEWDGWGTALKPAHEAIIVARKPLAEKTVAENVMQHGVGALNIDGSRVETREDARIGSPSWGGPMKRLSSAPGQTGKLVTRTPPTHLGRWPSNLLFSHSEQCKQLGLKTIPGNPTSKSFHNGYASNSQTNFIRGVSHPGNQHADANGVETAEAWACAPDCPIFRMDAAAGIKTSGLYSGNRNRDKTVNAYGTFKGKLENGSPGSTGPVSRYFKSFSYEPLFYESKASRKERTMGGKVVNTHPTVKPVALLKYLIQLVTPQNGIVLDPFAGSGSTLIAARDLGTRAIGIELSFDYCLLGRERLKHATPKTKDKIRHETQVASQQGELFA